MYWRVVERGSQNSAVESKCCFSSFESCFSYRVEALTGSDQTIKGIYYFTYHKVKGYLLLHTSTFHLCDFAHHVSQLQ